MLQKTRRGVSVLSEKDLIKIDESSYICNAEVACNYSSRIIK
jgi:hypothetical protein